MADEQTTEERPSIEFPNHGGVAFADLMDALAPEEGAEAAGDAGEPAEGARGADAQDAGAVPEPADQGEHPGDLDAAEPQGEPGGGDADGRADDAPADGGGAAEPPAGTADPAAAVRQIGNLSTAIEENLSRGYQSYAYDQVRQEYPRYFDALERHPRLLIGMEVPSMTGEGTEKLKDSADAKEWQEAVKTLLTQEINSRAEEWMSNSTQFFETVHASIDLFKNNPDLIPGTKGFNRELADAFAKMAKPYEVRSDGKLQGYSIPVQPLIEQLRAQTAKKPAAPAKKAPAKKVDPPQQGLRSKAAAGEPPEDFSTLFGTIGLPNLKI